MSVHLDTRQKLKGISASKDFLDLLARSTLSSEDKKILLMIYLEEKNLALIGDIMGFSERTVKRRHHHALLEISEIT